MLLRFWQAKKFKLRPVDLCESQHELKFGKLNAGPLAVVLNLKALNLKPNPYTLTLNPEP